MSAIGAHLFTTYTHDRHVHSKASGRLAQQAWNSMNCQLCIEPDFLSLTLLFPFLPRLAFGFSPAIISHQRTKEASRKGEGTIREKEKRGGVPPSWARFLDRL